MNPKLLLLPLLVVVALYAFVDFGREGEVYTITEEPLVSMIKRKAADLNHTKIEEDFYKELEAQYTFKYPLPACNEEINTTKENLVIVPFDIQDERTGKIMFHKGQRVPYSLPFGQTFTFCFLDGSQDVEAQIKRFKQNENSCFYLAANADIRELNKKHNIEIGVLSKLITSSIEINCYPSAVQYIESKIHSRTYIAKDDER